MDAQNQPPPYNVATQAVPPPQPPGMIGAPIQGQPGFQQAPMMIPMAPGQPMPMAGQPVQYVMAQPGQVAPAPYGHPVGQQPQPQPGQWMPLPQGVPGCPPGLEYLTMIDQLLCHQKVELIEAFTSWESKNRYVIKNSMGQQIYFAFEESDLCMRQCCGALREFTMHIVDNNEQEVMRIYRPFKYCAGSCWFANMDFCSQECQVESPPGTVVATIHQTQSAMNLEFVIKDAAGQPHLRIVGPCCCLMAPQCFDTNFEAVTMDGQEIGAVQRQFSGLVKEFFTEADNFGVTFPVDLDVKMKAALLGATFLIDFMAFETTQNNNHHSY